MLALHDVVAFELGLPHRLMGSAVDDDGTPLYEVRVATLDGGPIMSSAGFEVLPRFDVSILEGADTVVIPGHYSGPAMRGEPIDDTLRSALAAAHRRSRIVSICTGAFVLGAAGVLDGRPATTHWLHAARFRRLYPQVDLDPDVLFVDDGDVLTSAGNAAGIDLLLHVIRRDHGADVANRVARRTVVAPWRDGGQAQFAEEPPVPDVDGDTGPTRAWALTRLGDPLTLADLAGHARMSVRSFTRRFRDETGESPQRWLVGRRLDLARRLLETTDLPVEQVATRAGFGTTTSLRQHLHTALGMAPLAYRRVYRGTPVVSSVTKAAG
ncbi:transcriptional regulator, AraC family [Pseudonocardia sp. N23]|nr:transcriptional regulator, AraC family [Pseudonocardia sp. N23]